MKLKVKGWFARLNKLLGGYDLIEAKVLGTDTNRRMIKESSSKIESGTISQKKHLYNIAASTFLERVLGKESFQESYQ